MVCPHISPTMPQYWPPGGVQDVRTQFESKGFAPASGLPPPPSGRGVVVPPPPVLTPAPAPPPAPSLCLTLAQPPSAIAAAVARIAPLQNTVCARSRQRLF